MNQVDFIQNSIQEYINMLSDRAAVPGGGSASALIGATGAALNLMVINYSVKSVDLDVWPELLRKAYNDQNGSLARISELVNEDCKKFTALMRAIKSKKNTQEKFIEAAGVPLKICRECLLSLKITANIIGCSNKNLISDIGCAANAIKASFDSAKLNVEINLQYIEDEGFVNKSRSELSDLSIKASSLFDDICFQVHNIMSG